MSTAKDVFSDVRDLVDDLEEDYATDVYLVGKLGLAQKEVTLRLYRQPNLGRYKAAVVLPNVVSGAVSLRDYFAPGKPLELLRLIQSMREKPAGSADQGYQEMVEQTIPPTIAPSAYNVFYTFTEDDILLPGASQALDIRIFGSFDPKPIKDKDSPLLPGSEVTLSYLTAAIAARAHGNRELGKDLHDKGEVLLDELMNNMIMESQSEPSRPRANSAGADSAGII